MDNKTLSELFLGPGIFFGALLLAGTFWDLKIAQALYIENCRPAMAIAFVGFLLFFMCCTFFLGAVGAIKMCFSYALPKKGRRLMFWRKNNDGSSSDQIQD